MLTAYIVIAFVGLAAAGDYDPVYMESTTRLSIIKTKVVRLVLTHDSVYLPNADNKLSIQSKAQTMMVIAPRKIDIEGTMPNCESSKLVVTDVNTKEIYGEWCGKTLPEKFPITTESYLKLEFISGPKEVNNTGFDLIITETNTGTCTDQEYMCADIYCIDKRFQCDGYVNCPDKSDEDPKFGCYVSTSVAPLTTANVTNATSPHTNATSPITAATSTIPRTTMRPTKTVTTFMPISTTQSATQNGFNMVFVTLVVIGTFVLGKW